jgi:hypothetical protein
MWASVLSGIFVHRALQGGTRIVYTETGTEMSVRGMLFRDETPY